MGGFVRLSVIGAGINLVLLSWSVINQSYVQGNVVVGYRAAALLLSCLTGRYSSSSSCFHNIKSRWKYPTVDRIARLLPPHRAVA